MGIEQWSTSAGSNNQSPPNGWPSGMLPSQVEPTARQMMASVAAWYQAAQWINYNLTPVYLSNTQFTIAGNVTSTYHVDRRVQATDGSTSVYGTITASAFTTLTTVTVTWDSGVLQTGVTIVYVGITSAINTSAPTQALTSAAFANPSASIGLTAINGSATTAMRSDAAPALSQSIVPIWSGVHTFSAIPVFSAGVTISGSSAPMVSARGLTIDGEVCRFGRSGAINNPYFRALVTESANTVFIDAEASTGNPTLQLGSNGHVAISVNTSGAVTVSAPISGDTLTSTAVANNNALSINSPNTAGQSFGALITAGTNSSDRALAARNAIGTFLFQVRGDGLVQAVDQGGTLQDVGWRDVPQNSQIASYQLVLADRGKGVDFNGTSLTCTIPANGTVAFPIGTTIVITNLNSSNLSIAITTDTLTLAGTTTTGTRTLAQNGMASIRKVTSTSWLISGSGLS